MDPTRRKIAHLTLRVVIIGATALSIVPLQMQPTTALARSRTLGLLNIVVEGRFLDVWESGRPEAISVWLNGYPITERRPEISTVDGQTYDMQWFERARFEAHPENTAPHDVLLSLLGTSLCEGRGMVNPATKQLYDPSDIPFVGINKPADVGATKVWFAATRHSVSGKILEYWQKYGGIQQFGNPLSEPFEELSAVDGKPYTVQYFERNRFELRPSLDPPYDVQLGLLGVQQYKLTPIPADKLPFAPRPNIISESASLLVGSAARPASLVGIEERNVAVTRLASAITFQDGLVILDSQQKPAPTVAWYVPTLENGGTYYVGVGNRRHMVTKFKLRHGVKWSDGREVTSNDAVFAYSLMLKDPYVVSNQLWKKLSSVINPDKYTVIYNWLSASDATSRWRTSKTEYAFLEMFATSKKPVVDVSYMFVGAILPQHVLGNVQPDKLKASTYATNPVGFGPYMKGRQYGEPDLVENPNYNLTAKPHIKYITFRIMPSHLSVAEFLRNRLDAVTGEGFMQVPIECNSRMPPVRAYCYHGPGGWDHLDPYFDFPPFRDLNVRKAMIMAIDRENIVGAFFTVGGLMNSVVPPSVYYSLDNPDFPDRFPSLAGSVYKQYQDTVKGYKYNPAAAMKLLDDAGYTAPSPGATRVNAAGVQLKFDYAIPNIPKDLYDYRSKDIQMRIVDYLKAVGIEAVPKDPIGFFAPNGPVTTGQISLAQFTSYESNYSKFGEYSTDELWSAPNNMGKQNRQQYKNPRVTELYRALNAEFDPNKFVELAAQLQLELARDVAVIPLAQRRHVNIYPDRLRVGNRGVGPTSEWWNIMQWYFIK